MGKNSDGALYEITFTKRYKGRDIDFWLNQNIPKINARKSKYRLRYHRVEEATPPREQFTCKVKICDYDGGGSGFGEEIWHVYQKKTFDTLKEAYDWGCAECKKDSTFKQKLFSINGRSEVQFYRNPPK